MTGVLAGPRQLALPDFASTLRSAVEPARAVVRIVIPCSKRKSSPIVSEAVVARDLYQGRAFRRAIDAVDMFVSRRPDLPATLHIASAGYGLISATDTVRAYDA